MTELTVEGNQIIVEIKGWHKLFSFKSRLNIPLQHLVGSRPAIGERRGGFRAPGTYFPGWITAGTFYQRGRRIFWDVCDLNKSIAIDLRDDRYAKVIVEVADLASGLALIERAMALEKIRTDSCD